MQISLRINGLKTQQNTCIKIDEKKFLHHLFFHSLWIFCPKTFYDRYSCKDEHYVILFQILPPCHPETSLHHFGIAITKVRRCQCPTMASFTVSTSTQARIHGTPTTNSILLQLITITGMNLLFLINFLTGFNKEIFPQKIIFIIKKWDNWNIFVCQPWFNAVGLLDIVLLFFSMECFSFAPVLHHPQFYPLA